MTALPTVLLVEDDEALRSVLRRALSAAFVVITAGSHEDALRALATTSDLAAVLSDEQLGQGPPGHELLAEVERRFPRCLRVLMSGSHTKSHGTAHVFIRKPVDADALLRVLAQRLLTTP